jgi:large subunit ribosomal protein L30
MERLAIIRIRGTDDVNSQMVDTMVMLKLLKKHVCSIYDNTPNILGMAEKCKDYVTYGEIDEETYKLLVEKRGITKEGKLQNYFHLNPPRGGFERRGIKVPFTMKGALGYRGAKINDLIRKMV